MRVTSKLTNSLRSGLYRLLKNAAIRKSYMALPEKMVSAIGLGGVRARVDLLQNLPKHAVCAEIGVWKGDLSGLILTITQPKKLYLIDPWLHHDDYEQENQWYSGSNSNQNRIDRIYQSVVNAFQTRIQEGIVEVVRATSTDAADRFSDEYLDWVYIDGDHRYEYVRQDLLLYHEKVRLGGIISGDDYDEGVERKGGVKRAVDEFLEEYNVTFERRIKSQYILRKNM